MVWFLLGDLTVFVAFLLVYVFGALPATRDLMVDNLLVEIENNWINPIVESHAKTINTYNDIFMVYNRKIERLEKLFVMLGHEEMLDDLCKMDSLADKNSKVDTPEGFQGLAIVKKD